MRPIDIGPALPDPTNDMKPEPRPMCIACGRYHGGVNEGRVCLEREVLRLRARLAPIDRLRAEIAALPPSRVKERGR